MVSIALDFDGVIADQEIKKSKVLKSKYGLSENYLENFWDAGYLALSKLQLLRYSLQDYLGISKAEYADLQETFFNDLSDVIPVKGAVEGITSLRNLGYDLFIVTCRKEREEIPKWLEYYGIDLQVIYPKLGDAIPEIDYMLDDTPSKLASLENNIRIQSYLFSSPKNQECLDIKSRFIRVESWKEFLDKVALSIWYSIIA